MYFKCKSSYFQKKKRYKLLERIVKCTNTTLLVVKILKALLSDTHIEVFILQFGLLMIFKQLATPINNIVYRNFSQILCKVRFTLIVKYLFYI